MQLPNEALRKKYRVTTHLRAEERQDACTTANIKNNLVLELQINKRTGQATCRGRDTHESIIFMSSRAGGSTWKALFMMAFM